MTETIQQLKEDIALLQMKLQKLEETQMTLEKSGEFSIVSYNGETYYRNLYDGICGGWYKTDTDGEVFYLVEDETERKLEKLYHEQVIVKEPKKEQKWDVVRESVKWCEEHRDESVEDYLTPQTPDKIEENLREAFKKVQQTEEWKETQRKIDSNYDELVEKELTPNLQKIIDKMVEERKSQKLWNRLRDELGYSIDCCDEIVDLVEKWLPEPQSAAGSQNVDTELLVDGHNHCLNKMKEMLR